MAASFHLWDYTDDRGTVYKRNVLAAYSDQVDGGANPKIGGSLATTAGEPMPSWLKPRVALAQDAAGNKYRIVCNEADAYLYTTLNATFNIYDRDGGAAIPVTVYSIEGERRRSKLVK